MMRIRILRNKMLAVRQGTEVNASHELEGDTIAEGEACMNNKEGEDCPVHGKDDCSMEDPRSMPTKINLAKNKLRAMGLKMSYDMQGEMVDEEAYDSKKDKHLERGGVGARVDYKKPPSQKDNNWGKKPKATDYDKKLGNFVKSLNKK